MFLPTLGRKHFISCILPLWLTLLALHNTLQALAPNTNPNRMPETSSSKKSTAENGMFGASLDKLPYYGQDGQIIKIASNCRCFSLTLSPSLTRSFCLSHHNIPSSHSARPPFNHLLIINSTNQRLPDHENEI